MQNAKSKNGASVSKDFAYLTEVLCDISDFLFVQKDNYYLELELNA